GLDYWRTGSSDGYRYRFQGRCPKFYCRPAVSVTAQKKPQWNLSSRSPDGCGGRLTKQVSNLPASHLIKIPDPPTADAAKIHKKILRRDRHRERNCRKLGARNLPRRTPSQLNS